MPHFLAASTYIPLPPPESNSHAQLRMQAQNTSSEESNDDHNPPESAPTSVHPTDHVLANDDKPITHEPADIDAPAAPVASSDPALEESLVVVEAEQEPPAPASQTHLVDAPRALEASAPDRVNSRPFALQGQGRQGSSSSPERTYTAPSWHSSSRRPSYYTNPSDLSAPKTPRPTLEKTTLDLRILLKSFLVFLPSSLRKLRYLLPSPLVRLTRALIHRMAMALHKRGALATSILYDSLVVMWRTVINIFFREIRSRGAWKVPKDGEGAVIFVVGPHHNQFLDPLLLMSEVRREAGRRISFLVAEASMKRRFIGQAAKLMQSIPVVRAQDIAVAGTGTLTLDPENPCIIVGKGTTFLVDFAPKKQIMLPRDLGNATAEVVEVLDDNRVRIKKELNKRGTDGLRAKPDGVTYKILPYVDQTRMYSSVYQKLTEGGCIGIFPEGGSHDRTDLLPLKAGVSIMALGALSANPDLRLRIVPVGLSYFHPHRFRSRAVVEFGSPIEVPKEFVEDFEKGGEHKKLAIGEMMELVVDGLKSVTVRTPDYETLMLIQATRRLYRPPGQHLTLGQIVELNKRFIAGYEVYKDEPQLKALSSRVKEYNTLLTYMGLKDHQIEKVARPLWKSIILLGYRMGLFSAWAILALPGVVLNAPIFIAASYISRMKAKQALANSTVKIKGNDVLATWKVLVALAGAPALYSVYSLGATYLAFRYNMSLRYKIYAPIATMAGLPLIGYSALKFGEVGVDVYKSLRPLLLSVVPGNEKQLDKLRTMRAALQNEISVVVNQFGPQLFEDFQETRIIPPTARPPPVAPLLSRRSTYGPQGQGTFFTHPLTWVDEYLFGWSSQAQQPTPKTPNQGSDGGNESVPPSGYVSGYTTDADAPDYDEVIHILAREQVGTEDAQPESPSLETGSRLRRPSRVRSRSNLKLDFTALEAIDSRTEKVVGATGVEEKNATRRVGAEKEE